MQPPISADQPFLVEEFHAYWPTSASATFLFDAGDIYQLSLLLL